MRETQHEIDPTGPQVSSLLRVAGLSMVAAGAVLTLVGMISFFSAFGTFQFPRYFWCTVVGLPLLGFGLQISGLGFLGAFTRYVSGQTAPVQRDTFNYLAKETRGGVHTIAEAAAHGVAAGTGAMTSAGDVTCPQCHGPNAREAQFCDQCGAALGPKLCPRCHHANDSAGRFCSQCGCQLV
ncbi:MAG: zinc ribbon domain-containing protein [Isosphaeraceae bacterium]|nr:zinc ribbon domain-containing protein [Isosphaeraceae bacterium]